MKKQRPAFVPPKGTKLSREILSEHFHANLHFERTWVDDIADFLTTQFGSVWFLATNTSAFALWFVCNLGLFGITPFDPFPFNFLTMTVSLEAIFLSIVVLISQNRQSKVADIRQQIDFEINVRSEEEITKILQVLDELRHASGITKPDPELEQMKQKVDIQKIQHEAEEKNGNL